MRPGTELSHTGLSLEGSSVSFPQRTLEQAKRKAGMGGTQKRVQVRADSDTGIWGDCGVGAREP